MITNSPRSQPSTTKLSHFIVPEPKRHFMSNQNPFTGPQLQNTHHECADLASSHFDGVNLADAKFFAVLTNARFNDTNLLGATFDDVNISRASFNNITFQNTIITAANLTGMKINGILVTDLLAAYENP
jgi:uncharacterized protein YjbI with pentapeptide repeats